MQHSASDSTSTSPLDAILTLTHPKPVTSVIASTNESAVTSSSTSASPLTLIEDTLSCSADFLLLQAIQRFLTQQKGLSQTKSTTTTESTTPLNASQQPAVVFCTFKQSSVHYTHIARKWGIPFAPLLANRSLYLIDDLSHDPTATAASSSTDSASSAASTLQSQLDTWFGVDTTNTNSTEKKSPVETASPLQTFIARLQHLRSQHSSLLVIVDDLQWLFLHASGSEMEVLDALISLQISLASADAANPPTLPQTAVTPSMSSHAAFSLDSSSTPSTSITPVALSSGLVLVAHGDVPVSPVLSLLRRHSSTFIRLSGLQTGATKEITGVLSVQQHQLTTDYWTPIQRSHYKLLESSVKISAPGHSSSTLTQ